MIGRLPQGMFGLRQMDATSAPLQQQPREPFVWKEGGRVSPEDLALQRRRAQQMQSVGMDFSPVGHWTQGLARVAQGLVGSLQDRSLEQQQTANTDARNADIAALLGDGNADLAGALTSGDPVAEALAQAEYTRRNPKPVNNDTVADYNFITETLGPDAGKQFLTGKADPVVNIPLANGSMYIGPRSGMAAAMSGVVAPATLPADMPPEELPADFDFGGPTQPASGGFRP